MAQKQKDSAQKRKRGRPPRLDQTTERVLYADLLRGPRAFRYTASAWSGALVARHLARRYGVAISDRQGRRILRKLIPETQTLQPRDIRAHTRAVAQPPDFESRSRPLPVSDALNKERALRRIKRLAVSGLPLEPFVMALFALVDEGVPSAAIKVFLANSDRPDGYICNISEALAYGLAYEHYFIRGSPEQSGCRFKFDANTYRQLSSKTIWRHEEWHLPHYFRSEGYNEVMRPQGLHHLVSLTCSDDGRAAAFYPVWRGSDQKPFSRDDISFLEACAPHIAHGVMAASLLAESSIVADSSAFAALAGWTTGVVLMDQRERVVGIDDAARAIFAQMARFEAAPTDPALPARVRDSLDYIANTLKGIRERATDPRTNMGPPAVRVYSHRSGMVLKLRAVDATGVGGAADRVAVLVERGELRDQRRRSLMYRRGLNGTELAILETLRRDSPLRESAVALGVTGGTLKGYVRRLADKLGVVGTIALRAFAHEEF